MQTVLLTGATGFLGSHLLRTFLKRGYRVIILKRSTSNTWRINDLLHQVKHYDVDKEPLELAFEQQQIDTVVHTACHYGRNSDSLRVMLESNLLFGIRILEASLKFDTKTFINTDTLLINNINDYALSKKQFSEWLKLKSDKINIINLKLEHMYGPQDDKNKFVSWVLSQLKENTPEIKLTGGEQLRDFIYIDDVVSVYLTAIEKAFTMKSYEEFEVGTGVLTSVKQFIKSLKKSYEGSFGTIRTKLVFGAIPYRKNEMMTVDVDNKPLLELGWIPNTCIEAGLKNLIKEYK